MVDQATKMKWEGRWDQLKGNAKQTWGDLTDDDLDVAEGNYEELVGNIKERTGESTEEIEDRLYS
ncbi:MAG: CsbD family protein [Acidimicrobiia bacterium]